VGNIFRIESAELLQVLAHALPTLPFVALTPSLVRGDFEMALEPEVGFTLSGDALWRCGFYHVLPPQKLRVSQGALPIGEKASDKSDAVRVLYCACLESAARARWLIGPQVVEKRKPSADMTGRVMALLNCEDGFVVTPENFCKIPVLGCVCSSSCCCFAALLFARALNGHFNTM
jgi:hypothetical protein